MIRFWLYLFFVLACLSFWEPVETRRARYKPEPPKPKKTETQKAIDTLAPGQNINIDQMSGKWHLLTVASRCKNLLESGFKTESTSLTWNITADTVTVGTVRKLNFVCWEIKQNYMKTKTPGQLFLKGKRPSDNVDIMVLETDYSTYAMLVFKRAEKITMKLYGRSGEVPDNIVDKFEDRAKTFNLGLDVVFQFPDYGFCESAEKVLDLT
ncbi:complement component C8 gamma chain precursor [Danio rerio]|uniref:Complement component 8, gamma polypeptide n=1 Tax=Danio rerio TaxID=7955 RepID=Q6P5J2_DANRE|nr:complement component C8 gamma chain precursor [Danio rerio]AAH62865.1 Complement component 8, gamma polypeptide [Danio rerio]|eukprot:NP_957157.1 complement component C8 gamma chain precursor [Danio rerio]